MYNGFKNRLFTKVGGFGDFTISTCFILQRPFYPFQVPRIRVQARSYADDTGPKDQLKPRIENNASRLSVPKNWRTNKSLPDWQRQKFALEEKFQGASWQPKKKLSREQMDMVREIKQQNPNMNSGDIGNLFKISPEAIRRILKSKWRPDEKEKEHIDKKWIARKQKVREIIKETRAPLDPSNTPRIKKWKNRKKELGETLF